MISEFVILLRQKRHWGPFETLRRDPMLRTKSLREGEVFVHRGSAGKSGELRALAITLYKVFYFMKYMKYNLVCIRYDTY